MLVASCVKKMFKIIGLLYFNSRPLSIPCNTSDPEHQVLILI